MVGRRPSVIFGGGTKNFLDDDLLADALRSIREVVDVA
jgi:coproporphyrinogen III oxidase-like Fe-S oxidoreductase